MFSYLMSMLIPLFLVVAEWTRLSPYSGCLMPQLVNVFRTWSGFVPKFSLYEGWVMASWNTKYAKSFFGTLSKHIIHKLHLKNP